MNGLGQGLQWVAQGKYISDCAATETKGFFFGYFWGVSNISFALGCLIAELIFQNFNLTAYYLFMAGFVAVSIVMLLMLKDPKCLLTSEEID